LPDADELPSSPDGWFDQLEEISRDEDITYPAFSLDVSETDFYNDFTLEESDMLPGGEIDMQYCEPAPQPDLNPFMDGGNIEGWTLLSHYKDRIVPLISPLRRGQETPWISLVIPCAVTTLGELALNGTANHARLALLNALWSTSVFHLANNSKSWLEQWKISGEQYLKRAQYHFQRCMEECCISSTKTSKYKEILMAILSLSNAFVRHRKQPV